MYTNDWDPNDGQILISADRGDTWTASKLPFKVMTTELIVKLFPFAYNDVLGWRKHAWTRDG